MEGVSTDDIRDIYEIRALLEGLCARWAATRISDELMAAMEANIYLTEFHEKKGNAKKLLELDDRFHELLYEAGGSKELMRVLKDYHEYVGLSLIHIYSQNRTIVVLNIYNILYPI